MSPLLPDLLLLALIFVVLFAGLGRGRRDLPYHLAWIGLVATGVALALLPANIHASWLQGAWTISSLGVLVRALLVFSALATVLLARSYFQHGGDGQPPLRQPAEFYMLILVSTFGGFTVVSAADLATLFIGLELATIPLFFLAGWNTRDPLSGEAATKYIVAGGVSTAAMMFALGYLYGFAGTLTYSGLAAHVASDPSNPLLWLAVVFMLSAIGFKLTLFPFHMWAPDVYEGATTPVAAYLSVSSKSVGVAFLLVMLFGPLAAIHTLLEPLLLLLAVAAVTAGNLGALKQSRLRRFMAYSGVAQAGVLMLAFAGPAPVATTAIVFYLFVYASANYLAFFVFGVIGRHRPESYEGLRGLGRQRPLLGLALAVGLLSLAGIPPLAGFIGKFGLLAAAAENHYYWWIAYVALNGLLSLYGYLMLLRPAWVVRLDEGETTADLHVSGAQQVGLLVLTFATLGLGLCPWLYEHIAHLVQ